MELVQGSGGGKKGGRKGGKAVKVRETVRAGLGEDWGEVLMRMGERKDGEDGVWRKVEEESWETEMGVEGEKGRVVEGAEGGGEFQVELGGGGVVDVAGGPRWERGTGGGSVNLKPEEKTRGDFMKGVRARKLV